jgi:hypothetical protein
MPDFATFGNVTFEVVGAFETITFEDASHYAKIDVIGQPPVLQWIFDDLTKLKFDIKLHQAFCDPQQAIAALQYQRTSHYPAAFTIGSNNEGNYIITKLEETDLWRSDDGSIIASQLKLELLQWAGQLPQNAPSNGGGQQQTSIGLTTTDQDALSPLLVPVASAVSIQQGLQLQALADASSSSLLIPGLPVLGPFVAFQSASLLLATRL